MEGRGQALELEWGVLVARLVCSRLKQNGYYVCFHGRDEKEERRNNRLLFLFSDLHLLSSPLRL